MLTEMELTLEQTQQGVSYEVSFDESDTYVLERLDTSAGNHVKEILLKLNLPYHRIFKDRGEEHAEFDESDTYVLERFDTSAGNPVKEILLKLNLPDHRIFKDRGEDDETRLCLVDDLKNIRVISFTMKMEILLEPTSNKLMVGDVCYSIGIKLVTTGKKRCEIVTRWFTLIVLSALRRSDNENMLSLMNLILMCYKDSILQLEILSRRFFFKLNLPDHRIFKDGGKGT
ncbi:hypothetical protein Tco_0611247 [Tanacetum coccineum]